MERNRVRAGVATALLLAGLAGSAGAAGATTTGPSGPSMTGPTGPTGLGVSGPSGSYGFGHTGGDDHRHHRPDGRHHDGGHPSGASGTSGAIGFGGGSFTTVQTALERQLALRTTRLSNLSSDIAGAKSLTSTHVTALDANLANEKASIASLVAKVPSDTTMAELRADAQTMLTDNRVFAVMSPQVFETIGGDAVLATDATLSLEQSSLLSEVTSLAGQPGYSNASEHYQDFVRRLAGISTSIAADEALELNATPTGYPQNQHLFVRVNRDILRANVSLAYATYDASVIGLATGGYTGG